MKRSPHVLLLYVIVVVQILECYRKNASCQSAKSEIAMCRHHHNKQEKRPPGKGQMPYVVSLAPLTTECWVRLVSVRQGLGGTGTTAPWQIAYGLGRVVGSICLPLSDFAYAWHLFLVPNVLSLDRCDFSQYSTVQTQIPDSLSRAALTQTQQRTQ